MPLLAQKTAPGGIGVCLLSPARAPTPRHRIVGLSNLPTHTGELRPQVWGVLGFPLPVSPGGHDES